MKILLVSCYNIDAGPPSFYSVFETYVPLCTQFQEHGWQPFILSDRKNVPLQYLSLKNQFVTVCETRGRRAKIRAAMRLMRHTLQNSARKPWHSIILSHTVPSLSNWIREMGFQAVIHFGGVRDDSHAVNFELRRSGIPVLFVERGWLPQTGHLYFDPEGTNYRSTLSYSRNKRCPSEAVRETREYLSGLYPKPTSTDGPIVVPLQLEQDANNRYFSPYFHSNRYFLKFLSTLLEGENVVFCPHPLESRLEKKPSKQKYGDLERPGFRLAPEGFRTIDLVPAAPIIIGINSTILIEALAYDKPVVAYGKGVFTGNGVMLEADVHTSREEILSYVCDRKVAGEFLPRLLRVQFAMNDISKLKRELELMVHAKGQGGMG